MRKVFREATFDDIPRIVDLLQEFYWNKGAIYGIPFDAATTMITVEKVVRHGVCIVGPNSCAGAMIVPFPYNHAVMIASVIFWYFKQSRELKIFPTLAGLCRKRGAEHLSVASHFPENTISRYYNNWGFAPAETLHVGSLLVLRSNINGGKDKL
jgi:hypothetical protein